MQSAPIPKATGPVLTSRGSSGDEEDEGVDEAVEGSVTGYRRIRRSALLGENDNNVQLTDDDDDDEEAEVEVTEGAIEVEGYSREGASACARGNPKGSAHLAPHGTNPRIQPKTPVKYMYIKRYAPLDRRSYRARAGNLVDG